VKVGSHSPPENLAVGYCCSGSRARPATHAYHHIRRHGPQSAETIPAVRQAQPKAREVNSEAATEQPLRPTHAASRHNASVTYRSGLPGTEPAGGTPNLTSRPGPPARRPPNPPPPPPAATTTLSPIHVTQPTCTCAHIEVEATLLVSDPGFPTTPRARRPQLCGTLLDVTTGSILPGSPRASYRPCATAGFAGSLLGRDLSGRS